MVNVVSSCSVSNKYCGSYLVFCSFLFVEFHGCPFFLLSSLGFLCLIVVLFFFHNTAMLTTLAATFVLPSCSCYDNRIQASMVVLVLFQRHKSSIKERYVSPKFVFIIHLFHYHPLHLFDQASVPIFVLLNLGRGCPPQFQTQLGSQSSQFRAQLISSTKLCRGDF